MKTEPKRCWNTTNPLYVKYHDEEWGIPVRNDQTLFEFLALGGFQAGLTWELILKRREIFRDAFDNFKPKVVAVYRSEDVERILTHNGIIKNRAKILATINNAHLFLDIQKQFGSFGSFVWNFVGRHPINHTFSRFSEVPSKSEESIALSKDLKKRGFQFVGPKICYAFMQATGLVNDHLTNCFRYSEIKRMQSE